KIERCRECLARERRAVRDPRGELAREARQDAEHEVADRDDPCRGRGDVGGPAGMYLAEILDALEARLQRGGQVWRGGEVHSAGPIVAARGGLQFRAKA